MIARIWHGVAAQDKADEFFQYMNETGIPGLKGTEGNNGVYVLQRIENGQVHYLLISLWESYEAIARFAGDEIEKPRYFSRDQELLLELEPAVKHYEVLVRP